jgi:allophanate hydrolase subunit 2
MSDRQTTGGYAKIATVITPDLWLLAQARQGTKVRFVPVSASRARREAVKREGYFARMERNFIMGVPFSEKIKIL